MVSIEAARTTVGIVGNLLSLILFLSPVPTFIHIWKKGSVEQYSAVPYLATLVNCMVWVLYAMPMVHPHSTLLVTINGSGCAIELVYLALFFIFSDPKKRLGLFLVAFVELLLVAVVAALVLTFAHTYEQRSMVVGTICIVCNALMYASPLSVMKLVIRSESVEYLPLFLSVASLASGVAWASYALIRFDPFIIIPNGLGILFSLAQLTLHAVYYKSTRKQVAESAAMDASSKMGNIALQNQSLHQ